jgi:hypothetical protein
VALSSRITPPLPRAKPQGVQRATANCGHSLDLDGQKVDRLFHGIFSRDSASYRAIPKEEGGPSRALGIRSRRCCEIEQCRATGCLTLPQLDAQGKNVPLALARRALSCRPLSLLVLLLVVPQNPKMAGRTRTPAMTTCQSLCLQARRKLHKCGCSSVPPSCQPSHLGRLVIGSLQKKHSPLARQAMRPHWVLGFAQSQTEWPPGEIVPLPTTARQSHMESPRMVSSKPPNISP